MIRNVLPCTTWEIYIDPTVSNAYYAVKNVKTMFQVEQWEEVIDVAGLNVKARNVFNISMINWSRSIIAFVIYLELPRVLVIGFHAFKLLASEISGAINCGIDESHSSKLWTFFLTSAWLFVKNRSASSGCRASRMTWVSFGKHNLHYLMVCESFSFRAFQKGTYNLIKRLG